MWVGILASTLGVLITITSGYVLHSPCNRGFNKKFKPGITAKAERILKFQIRKTSPLHAVAITNLIQACHSSKWYVWTLLSLSSNVGLLAESSTIGAALSSPLVTMFVSILLCNTGILPPLSPVYNTILNFLVPLAIPLLLLDADLAKVLKSSERLLTAFMFGTIGTVIGTIVAYKLVPMSGMEGASKIAAALCARHIGGAVNFVAVSDVLQTPSSLVTAAMAADNVVVAMYFAFLFAVTKADHPTDASSSASLPVASTGDRSWNYCPINLISLSGALSFSFLVNLMAQLLYRLFGLSPIVSVSTIAVALATIFPVQLQNISQAGGCIGVMCMQMFFAVTGAMGHIPSVLKVAPSVFMHATVQIVVHFFVSLGLGKLFKLPMREIALASNANVGGPTTAAAMANSKNWKTLVLPALLTGVFGYSIATGIGLLVHKFIL